MCSFGLEPILRGFQVGSKVKIRISFLNLLSGESVSIKLFVLNSVAPSWFGIRPFDGKFANGSIHFRETG